MKTKHYILPLTLLCVYLLRWQILQFIAWTTMFIRYAGAHGLAEGWRMTFDGNHPCAICRAIATGTAMEGAVLTVVSAHPSILPASAAVVMIVFLVSKPRPILQ